MQGLYSKTSLLFALLSALFVFQACQSPSCSKKEPLAPPPPRPSAASELPATSERVEGRCHVDRWGVLPRLGGMCLNDQTCLLASEQRFSWSRCVQGQCLYGTAEEDKGSATGLTALAEGNKGLWWTGSQGGEIRLWASPRGRTLRRWQAHQGPVIALLWTPLGLWSSGDDRSLRLWDEAGRLVSQNPTSGRFSDLAFSSSQNLLAAASSDRKIRLSPLHAPPSWETLEGHCDAVRSVVFHPSEPWLLSASDDGTLRLWDLRLGRLQTTLSGHRGWIRRALFLPPPVPQAALRTTDRPSEPTVALSAGFDRTLRFWDLQAKTSLVWGEALDLLPSSLLNPPKEGCLPPNDMKGWSLKKAASLQGHTADIASVAVSMSGRWLLSTSHRAEITTWPDGGSTAYVWDRVLQKKVCTVGHHRLGLTHVRASAFAPLFVFLSEDATLSLVRPPVE